MGSEFNPQHCINQAQQCTPDTMAFRSWMQKEQTFKVIPSYTLSLRPTWPMWDPDLERKWERTLQLHKFYFLTFFFQLFLKRFQKKQAFQGWHQAWSQACSLKMIPPDTHIVLSEIHWKAHMYLRMMYYNLRMTIKNEIMSFEENGQKSSKKG